MVDDLGDIPEVPVDDVIDIETLRWGERLPAKGIVRSQATDDPQAPLLVILDMNRLRGFLGHLQSPLAAAE
jgi:hypothetical protein